MENFERIKELVNELKKIIDEMEKNKPYQSEVGKSFQQVLAESLEKKNRMSVEKIL